MKFVVYIILFLITNVTFSQSKTTLSNKEFLALQDKVKTLMGSNVDSSFLLSNKIEKSNNDLHKAFAAGAKCYLYQLKGDSIKSKQYYRLAFSQLAKVPPSDERTKLKAGLFNLGGLADWTRGNFGPALDKYEQGKALSESINDQPQVVKFNNNIAIINDAVRNYRLAINITKQTDQILDKFSYLFENDRVISSKSNAYLHLGRFYELYYKEKKDKKLLDSALFFYKKATAFSKEIFDNKIRAQMGVGNVYYLKHDYDNTTKTYQSLLTETKKKNYGEYNFLILYNLGDSYFNLKQYDKALVYFQKSDSIYNTSKINYLEYVNSNYYQAKIYEANNNHEKALKHSRIYLDNLEKNEAKLNKEATEVNSRLESAKLKDEMVEIQNKYERESFLKEGMFWFFIILFILLIVFLIKNIREKKLIKEKVNKLILEFTNNIEEKDKKLDAFISRNPIEEDADSNSNKKEAVTISIDEEKENEIVEKLYALEKKLQFLNSDFTQQIVAKKIKTNTTYLSYVVNKRFGKTFSEYSNELKINYAINEMITNPTYRKYSTQAIAESVGFKNAISFTKSFNKRTGVTPVQFIKGMEKS